MLDTRLNDRGLTEQQRWDIAHGAGLIPADHPQLWKDSALLAALERRGGVQSLPGIAPTRQHEPEQRHETVRLFEPAPAQIPGQLGF